MFYGDKVEDTRPIFFQSWQKFLKKQELNMLEKQIAAVIAEHPEYHSFFSSDFTNLDKSYLPEMGETNPFFHLGLHLAIRDQVKLNRPQGIQDIHQQLQTKYKDNSQVEHLMMERLAECLWQASKTQTMPNELKYINELKALINN